MTMTTLQETPFATITVPRIISKYAVQGLLVGLFENGCSSWLRAVKKRLFASGLKNEDFREGGKMQDPECYFHPTQIIPVTEGCALILLVDDPDTGQPTKEFRLDTDAIRRGLEVMAAKYPGHFNDFLEENDDANTADIFGQCVCYGEEVFS